MHHLLQGVVFMETVSGIQETEVVARCQVDAFVHGIMYANPSIRLQTTKRPWQGGNQLWKLTKRELKKTGVDFTQEFTVIVKAADYTKVTEALALIPEDMGRYTDCLLYTSKGGEIDETV